MAKSKKTAIILFVAVFCVIGFLLGIGSYLLRYNQNADDYSGSEQHQQELLTEAVGLPDALILQSIATIQSMVEFPFQTNPNTVWENVEPDLEKDRLIYNYKVSNIGPDQIKQEAPIIREQAVAAMCMYPDVKKMLKEGGGYEWRYYGEKRALITSFELVGEDGCN